MLEENNKLQEQLEIEKFRNQIKDELKLDEVESTEQVEDNNEPQYTPEEMQAMEAGWDPNYQGENRVDAREFLRVGQIIEAKRAASKRAELASKEVQELTKTVKQLVEHNKQLEKASYEKALKELQAQKRTAIENGDVQTFDNLEQQEKLVQQQVSEAVKSEVSESNSNTPPELKPEAKEFIERNKDWFNNSNEENQKMAFAASQYEQFKLQTSPNKSYAEILKETEEFVKREFPHRFENQNKSKPAVVLKSTAPSTAVKTAHDSLLSREQRDIFYSIKKADPSYSMDDYIKQLDVMGKLDK